jgi:hypothetical protein
MVSERVNGSMKSPQRVVHELLKRQETTFDRVEGRGVIDVPPIESETDHRMLA